MITLMLPWALVGVIGVSMVQKEGGIYEWYNGPFAEWLGLGCATGFSLNESDMDKISSLGIPLNALASAEEGRRKCGNDHGANVDIGILLAIMEREENYDINGYDLSLELYENGYNAEQTIGQKIDSLHFWNSSYFARLSAVTRSEALNAVIGAINVFNDASSIARNPTSAFFGGFRQVMILVLDSIGLLPERAGWLKMPLREEDLNTKYYADGISQGYMDTFFDEKGHAGIDFVCKGIGVDVLSVASGVVIEPSPGTVMYYYSVTGKDTNYGNNVWVNHNGIYALYAHLDKVKVKPGDKVVQGEVLGLCGSTGHSTGPHVHFQVLDIHPDGMGSYRQENPGNIDPSTVLGTCFVLKKEEE